MDYKKEYYKLLEKISIEKVREMKHPIIIMNNNDYDKIGKTDINKFYRTNGMEILASEFTSEGIIFVAEDPSYLI